jgi:ribosome-associated protein
VSFSIPLNELQFRATRASGPGGQHVNKASTRAEALWDVTHTRVLSETERRRVLHRLANRLDSDGRLRVAADERRSFTQNRAAAIERLEKLVDRARRAPKRRKPTKPTPAARHARLREKRRRADIKRERGRPHSEE